MKWVRMLLKRLRKALGLDMVPLREKHERAAEHWRTVDAQIRAQRRVE